MMLAAKNGKAEALEALLDDQRVDADECDEEDRMLEEIIKTSRIITTEFERNKTLSIIEKFRIRQRQPSEGGKVAIIIGNSIYKNGMSHLEGAKRDMDEVSAIMEKVHYKVHKVENSEDILADIETVMEGVPDSSITHLHLHYTGNEKHNFFSKRIYFTQVTANSATLPNLAVPWPNQTECQLTPKTNQSGMFSFLSQENPAPRMKSSGKF